METFFHTVFCVACLIFRKRGIAHLHGIGPGAFAPILRLLRFQVIFTHHGYNYEHEKWGKFAGIVLKLAEFLSVSFSNDVIAVSGHVARELSSRFKRSVHYIPNGCPPSDSSTPITQGVNEQIPFFLLASRFTPEKRIGDAIDAFSQLQRQDVRLIIAGSAFDPNDYYEQSIRHKASALANVEFIGFVSHEVLSNYMKSCLAFLNTSSHEGLPISVLEAGAQGAKLVLSDIPGHREFQLPSLAYYNVGDIESLTQHMRKILCSDPATMQWRLSDEKLSEYSWNRIADKTLRVYCSRHG